MTATAAPRPAVAVSDLRMRYGAKDVLHGVSFAVERGEVVTLLGPNGAGKTTIIEILEGFRMPSAGAVEVLGTDPAHADEDWRARVGIVLQSWRDHGKWRVRQLLHNLGRFYEPYATADRPRPRPVDELIETVGLTEQANQRISTLSGGQRRRLDVAIGLIGRPELLFLDEPTAGFDPEARRDFHDLVRGLSDGEETTIFLTTHDLDEAEKLADRIVILASGRIVADGTVDDLARSVSTTAEVRWTRDGVRHTETTTDATAFVRDAPGRRGRGRGPRGPSRQPRGHVHGDGPPRRGARRMSPAALHGVRIGLERGWIMFRHIITTADGIWNTVIWNGIPLAILILNRDEVVEGTDLSLAVVALPGFLGLMIAASAIGPAYYLAAEREDGTVLRAKAVPHGILGYVTGVLTQASLETFLGIALILIPGFVLFPGLVVDDPLRWGVFVIVVVLGLLAVLPAGVVIGSLVRSPRLVGGIGFLRHRRHGGRVRHPHPAPDDARLGPGHRPGAADVLDRCRHAVRLPARCGRRHRDRPGVETVGGDRGARRVGARRHPRRAGRAAPHGASRVRSLRRGQPPGGAAANVRVDGGR